MRYCTNCGAETNEKICTACGVKNNKSHNYCYWCGNPINANASICTSCHESVRNLGTPLLFKLVDVGLVLLNLFFFCGFVFVDGNLPAGIIHLIAIILLLPFVSKWIKGVSHDKKNKKFVRNLMYTGRVLVVIVLFVVGTAVGFMNTSIAEESCALRLPDLPMTVVNQSGSETTDFCEITEITYEFSYNSSGEPVRLEAFFSGEKVVGYRSQSDPCVIAWKLYNPDNAVVDSGSFYTPSLTVGERFSGESTILFYEPDGLETGIYRLELSDTVIIK